MRVNKPPTSRIKRKRQSRFPKPEISSHACQPSFKNHLEDSIKKELREKLHGILKDIDFEGKNVVRQKTLKSLLKYKKMVKTFLDIVIKNIYHLKEKVNLGSRGKPNILILIEKVDKSLEELVKMVLNNEFDNLKLLEKIGEIRGILIDTYS